MRHTPVEQLPLDEVAALIADAFTHAHLSFVVPESLAAPLQAAFIAVCSLQVERDKGRDDG